MAFRHFGWAQVRLRVHTHAIVLYRCRSTIIFTLHIWFSGINPGMAFSLARVEDSYGSLWFTRARYRAS